MTTINLKDFYYWYTQDQFIEVSDEVAEVFVSDARHEMAYQRRLSRHKAQYSLAAPLDNLSRSTKKRPHSKTLCRRMKLHYHNCTDILYLHSQTVPEGELRFF